MKRIGILVLIYVVGGISGVVYHSMTTGAVDRARIASLDGELKARNEKLEKCSIGLTHRDERAQSSPLPASQFLPRRQHV